MSQIRKNLEENPKSVDIYRKEGQFEKITISIVKTLIADMKTKIMVIILFI